MKAEGGAVLLAKVYHWLSPDGEQITTIFMS